jgi:hypothetical protein
MKQRRCNHLFAAQQRNHLNLADRRAEERTGCPAGKEVMGKSIGSMIRIPIKCNLKRKETIDGQTKAY